METYGASSSASNTKCEIQCESTETAETSSRSQPFKTFDILPNCFDHRYAKEVHHPSSRPKEWTKKIQQEWKILGRDLPDTIFVRVYEERMDLMRAAIIGADGTPYENGLFFFDIYFPTDYPNKPPELYYRSYGLDLNPNLYPSGFVCLSLLNTWHGKKSQRWEPTSSTMLQVLVSIQGLVLNADPYFNEPRRLWWIPQEESTKYNQTVSVLSYDTMVHVLQGPPLDFKELVVGHFRGWAHSILVSCLRLLEGGHDGREKWVGDSRYVANSKTQLRQIYHLLVDKFSKMGVDCDVFREAISSPSISEPDGDLSGSDDGKRFNKLFGCCPFLLKKPG